jgi:FKBP-type peptidyl-prolyl cis-trans isomerase FklB
MKLKGFFVITGIIALLLGSCAESSIKSAKMKSSTDSLSYAYGIVNYNALMADSLILNPTLVAKAMLDSKDEKPGMNDEEAREVIMGFINNRETARAAQQAEQNKITYQEYIVQNQDFLAKNKENAAVTVTPSGLQYEVIKMGTGPKPTAESTVKVHYAGTLIDGTEFDSSIKRNEPATFPVSGVIPGWTEALQLMPVGSKFKLCIPESIAYGANGAGEVIKPYSTLIFEVELLEIVE